MSQDLRDYKLTRLDKASNEARELSITATVGPTPDPDNMTRRGVQITLDTPDGFAYARLSEKQIEDMIDVLSARILVGTPPTATGIEAMKKVVEPDGSESEVPR